MKGGQCDLSVGSRAVAGQADRGCVQDRAVQAVEKYWN